jgi:hypothetical protein
MSSSCRSRTGSSSRVELPLNTYLSELSSARELIRVELLAA